MKISEMTNDQATEAMVQLTGPFNNICEDEKMLELLKDLNNLKETEEPMIKIVGRMVPRFVSLALKDHKADLYQIVSALTMTPVGKVGLMNFKATVDAIKDSYDDILAGFFTSSSRRMMKAANESAES